MSVSYADLRNWVPAGISDAGDCIKVGNLKIERAAETMSEQGFPKGWIGRGATDAAITRNRLVHQLQIQHRIREVFLKRVYMAEPQVRALLRSVELLDDEATHDEFTIDNDGTITDVHEYGIFPTPAEILLRIERFARLLALGSERDAILAAATTIDTVLAMAVRQAMDNDDPEPGIALPNQAIQDDWAAMTDAERRKVLENIAADLAEKYDVPKYSISFGPLDPNTNGKHNPKTHEITINTARLDDPVVINTIAHEMMHAGHDNSLENFPGLTPRQIEELRDNDDNYRGYSTAGWEEYRYQPEEDITRAEADEWVEGLTPEEMEKYR